MEEIDILLKNPNKLVDLLSTVLSSNELDKINSLRDKHCKLLLNLSKHHLNHAKKLVSSNDWRQKISRGYYSCYNASKAIRLHVNGEYSQEGKDHQKIGILPSDFPDTNTWNNFLTQYRSDRNIADYDHDKRCSDLKLTPKEYILRTIDFFNNAKKYLKNRGVL